MLPPFFLFYIDFFIKYCYTIYAKLTKYVNCKGVVFSFLRNNSILFFSNLYLEFDKNANSIYVGL